MRSINTPPSGDVAPSLSEIQANSRRNLAAAHETLAEIRRILKGRD